FPNYRTGLLPLESTQHIGVCLRRRRGKKTLIHSWKPTEASAKARRHSFDLGWTLCHLCWDSNQITSIPNEIFKDLHQLRVLNLSKNGIEFIDEHAFKGVAETLQTLDLSDNRIQSVHKNAFNNLKARARIANNPWHCDCTLQQVLKSMASNHETANNVICKTSVLDEHAGRPFLNAANDADLCNLPKKTTDYAMLVTMFGWFTMVISYVVYYVRQNQEDARRHLEYLKSLPSRQKKADEADDISTVV
uniref:Leucine rich repeat containing 3B n=1 Tax=Sarcophilus harrisii TaxID=9305 RepID=A0A7N4NI37_SARHA